MAKITLFGLAGTGTSSTGKALAEKLGYSFLSSGNFCREDAKKRGMSIYERGELAKKDPSFDKAVDDQIAQFGKEQTNFVVESWLAWYFIPDSIKLKLHCDFDTRVARVAHRDKENLEEAKKLTISREKSNAERFLHYYNIQDFTSDDHFEAVFDTTSTPLEEIVMQIEAFLKARKVI